MTEAHTESASRLMAVTAGGRLLAGLAGLATLLVAACGAANSATAHVPAAEQTVHRAFTLVESELGALARTQPETIAARIIERPRRFLELVDAVLDLPQDFTVLVDKNHALPADYEPEDLVSLQQFHGRIGYAAADRMVREAIIDDLLAMAEAARQQRAALVVQSAYRSWAYQHSLYTNYVARHGEEAAARFSARPGHSQHQLGTAVDFAPIGHRFSGTENDRWLRSNAWRFGFSLSYPEGYEELTGYIYEPWHYRYLGRAATQLEREFFEGVQQWMLEFLHDNADRLRAARVPRPDGE